MANDQPTQDDSSQAFFKRSFCHHPPGSVTTEATPMTHDRNPDAQFKVSDLPKAISTNSIASKRRALSLTTDESVCKKPRHDGITQGRYNRVLPTDISIGGSSGHCIQVKVDQIMKKSESTTDPLPQEPPRSIIRSGNGQPQLAVDVSGGRTQLAPASVLIAELHKEVDQADAPTQVQQSLDSTSCASILDSNLRQTQIQTCPSQPHLASTPLQNELGITNATANDQTVRLNPQQVFDNSRHSPSDATLDTGHSAIIPPYGHLHLPSQEPILRSTHTDRLAVPAIFSRMCDLDFRDEIDSANKSVPESIEDILSKDLELFDAINEHTNAIITTILELQPTDMNMKERRINANFLLRDKGLITNPELRARMAWDMSELIAKRDAALHTAMQPSKDVQTKLVNEEIALAARLKCMKVEFATKGMVRDHYNTLQYVTHLSNLDRSKEFSKRMENVPKALDQGYAEFEKTFKDNLNFFEQK